jgi:two-component system, OmpR family, KDP operon response regulator KdpE
MPGRSQATVVVAHRRPPVLRLVRTNLEAEGFTVHEAATALSCRRLIAGGRADLLVTDADLIRGDSAESARLLAAISLAAVPLIVLSWNPGDRLLARALGNAPFVQRIDDVDDLVARVRELIATGSA